MLVSLVSIREGGSPIKRGRGAAQEGYEGLIETYLRRCHPLLQAERAYFRSEEEFLDWLGRLGGRTRPVAVLLDSRGRQMSSEEFAAWLGSRRDDGLQQLVVAVGPADGWSETARRQAGLLLSFGPMTLAHSLAALVAAEQIYRACTILSGHPYHTGH